MKIERPEERFTNSDKRAEHRIADALFYIGDILQILIEVLKKKTVEKLEEIKNET